MRMPALAALLLAVLLAGCALPPSKGAVAAAYVGQSDQALIAGLGVPSRSYETGGLKYLAYDDTHVQLVSGAPGPAFGYGPWPWGYGGDVFPPQVVTYTCETTFTVGGGRVLSYFLRGNACG